MLQSGTGNLIPIWNKVFSLGNVIIHPQTANHLSNISALYFTFISMKLSFTVTAFRGSSNICYFFAYTSSQQSSCTDEFNDLRNSGQCETIYLTRIEEPLWPIKVVYYLDRETGGFTLDYEFFNCDGKRLTKAVN